MGSGQRSYSNVSGASKDYLNLFPKQGSLEGAPVITLHPRSGGPVAQASAVATPTVRRTDLVLAKIENHTLNSSLLAADDPGLAETLALISEGSKFEKLFLDDYEAPTTRALSRGMLQYGHDLEASGVIESTREIGHPALNAFLTEKKSGEGRFILDCRAVNRAQKRPPKMRLPKIQDIIKGVLQWTFAAQCDGKSYFYQFELAPSVRNFFPMRLAELRGKIAEFRMIKMPMGWCYAPYIAQETSNFITREIGYAWVDNFIVGGHVAARIQVRQNEAP